MSDIFSSPFFGIALTVGVFMVGRVISRKVKIAVANEMFIAVFLCILFLSIFQISFDNYVQSSIALNFMIIPATIALAYRVYEQIENVKKYLIPLLVGTIVGSSVSIFSVIILSKLFPIPTVLVNSLIPKSVTTAIAMEVSTLLHGKPSITILAVMVTGFTGVLVNPLLIRLLKIKDPIVIGLGFGINSHVIGTTKAFDYGEVEGAMGSIAIFFTGIATVLISLLLI